MSKKMTRDELALELILLQERERANREVVLELRRYLALPKFQEDTTVQVSDVLLRLEPLELLAHEYMAEVVIVRQTGLDEEIGVENRWQGYTAEENADAFLAGQVKKVAPNKGYDAHTVKVTMSTGDSIQFAVAVVKGFKRTVRQAALWYVNQVTTPTSKMPHVTHPEYFTENELASASRIQSALGA